MPSIWGGDSAFLPLPIKFGIEISAVCWSDLGVGRISGDPSDSSFPGMEVWSGFAEIDCNGLPEVNLKLAFFFSSSAFFRNVSTANGSCLVRDLSRMVVSLQRHPVFSMLPQGSARLESRPTYRWMRVLQLKRSRKYSQYTVAIQVCMQPCSLRCWTKFISLQSCCVSQPTKLCNCHYLLYIRIWVGFFWFWGSEVNFKTPIKNIYCKSQPIECHTFFSDFHHKLLLSDQMKSLQMLFWYESWEPPKVWFASCSGNRENPLKNRSECRTMESRQLMIVPWILQVCLFLSSPRFFSQIIKLFLW